MTDLCQASRDTCFSVTALIAPVLLMFLSGCSILTHRPDASFVVNASTSADRDIRLKDLASWQFSGRLFIKEPGHAWHLGVKWQQEGSSYQILLRSALGQGLASIRQMPGAATLILPDQPPLLGRSADVLLEQAFSWRIPAARLRYWVLAIDHPVGGAEVRLDDQGLISDLRDGEWRVNYRRYQEVAGIKMPRLIVVNRNGIELRLVIDHWILVD